MANEVAALGLKVDPSGITEGIKALDDLAARGPKAEKAMDAVGESAAKASKSLKTLGQGSAKGLEDVGQAAPKAAESVGRLSKSAENANSSLSKISSSASGLGNVATASAQSAKSVESLSASLAQTQKTLAQMQMQLQTASAATANLGKAQSDAARNATNVAAAYKSAGERVSAYARAPEQAAVANQRLSKSMEATASAARLISSAFAISGIGLGASQIIALSDGYTKFTAQLKLATKSASDYALAMGDVQRIAYGAQVGISEIGTLYARIANGTAELGLSQQRLADITEVVALSLKVSGATAAESSSAMLQLSQAFGSGVLRGEEFNAVNEAAPRLMKALADGIGVPIGALRKMAEAGELTSKVLAEALPKALAQVRTEAEKIQTIGGAFTNLNSKMMEFVGGAGEASGAAKAIANSVLLVADNLGVVSAAFGAAALVMTGRYVGALTAAAAANRAAAVAAEASAIASTAASRAALAGSTSFQAMGASATTATFGVTAMAVATRAAGAALAFFGGPIGLAITALGVAASAFLYLRDSSEEAIKSIGGLNQPLGDLKKKLDELPPEKRISILIDVEKSGKEAVRDAQKSIEDLTNFVRVFGNYTLPAEEVRKYTDELQKTEAAGGDLTPVLKRAAEAGQVPQKVLQRWLDLAANIREARSAAANAEAALAAAGTNVGGGRGTINPPTIAEMNASARAEAQSVLQATTAYKSKAEQIAELRGQEEKLQAALNGLISTNQGASKSADDLRLRLSGVADRMAGLQKSTSSGSVSIKDTENAYKSLSNRVSEYIAQLQQEVAQGGKVTNSQKMQIQLDELLASSKSKVSKAALQALQNSIKTAAGLEQEAAAAENAAKAYEEGLKWKAEWYAAQGKNLEEIKSANNRIREEIQLIGLSQDAQQALDRARIEATLTVREQHLAEMQRANDANQFSSIEQQNLEMEIALLKERLGLLDDKRVRTANVEAAKELENQWNKTSQTIGDTLADYIMGGGKDAAQYLKRLFSNLVLQPVVQMVVGGIFGGGGAGGVAAQASNLAGMASGLNNLWNVFNKGAAGAASSLVGKFVPQLYDLGFKSLAQGLGAFQAGMASQQSIAAFTSALKQGGAQMAGALAGEVMNGFAGYGISKLISGGYEVNKYVNKIAGVASAIPGVGLIAGVIGGAINRLFGRKLKDTGIEGTFGGEAGFVGNTYEYYKGGLFRSDKTKRSPLDEATRQGFADYYAGMVFNTKNLGSVLGLDSSALDSYTTKIKLSLKGLKPEEQEAKINEAFARIQNELAQQVIGTMVTQASKSEAEALYAQWTASGLANRLYSDQSIDNPTAHLDDADRQLLEEIGRFLNISTDGGSAFLGGQISSKLAQQAAAPDTYIPSEYALDGEKAIETLTRLASSLTTVNAVLEELNLTMYEGSLVGADMAYKLSELFGGLEGFSKATSSFYDNFFSEEEKRRKLEAKLKESLKVVGLELPDIDATNAREQYRKLAEAQDLSTEKGREAWAVLIQLSDAFAVLTKTVEDAAKAAEDAASKLMDNAWANFEAAVGRISERLNEQISTVSDAVDAHKSLGDTLKKVVIELRDKVQSTNAWSAARGMVYIEDALSKVRSGSSTLDFKGLEDAVAAARSGITTGAYVSQFDRDRDTLVLAGQLEELDELNGEQLSVEEKQLKILKDQLEYYEEYLKSAREMVDGVGNLIDKTLSPEQAYAILIKAMTETAGAGKGDLQLDDYLRRKADALTDPAAAAKQQLIKDTARSFEGSGDTIGLWNAIKAAGGNEYDLRDLYGWNIDDLRKVIAGIEAPRSASGTRGPGEVGGGHVIGGGSGGRIAPTAQDDYERRKLLATQGGDAYKQQQEIKNAATSYAGSGDVSGMWGAVSSAGGNQYDLAAIYGWDVKDIEKVLNGLGVPGFASGGLHAGGLRLVGERGPELEVTGPARYWDSSTTMQMLNGNGDDALVAEVRALRAEVAALRAANERTAYNTNGLPQMVDQFDQVTEGGNATRVEVMA